MSQTLFIAVPIEDEEDFEYLVSCSDRLKRHSSSGRFVRLANFHVTLVYLGETDRLEEVVATMDEALVGFSPFNLVLDQTGKFSRGKSSTVWVGGTSAKLTAIYEALWEALSDAGFELEKHKYTPHITLARNVVLAAGGGSGRRKGEGVARDAARGVARDAARGETRDGFKTGSGNGSKNAARNAHELSRKLAFENPPHVLPVRRITLFSSEQADTKRVYQELHSVDLGR